LRAGTIGCPTLVLVGDSDLLTPPELSVEIADGIPWVRLVVVAGSGHLTPLDQPEKATRRSWSGSKPEHPCGNRLWSKLQAPPCGCSPHK
jgi:poly(3-hydroxyalkanoate) synthetase